MEIELEFKSDSKDGALLSFVPSKIFRYPAFSILLQDGKVIAI